uniref:Nickel-dependent hydrogenase large subunit n=1 Tax=Fervidicoccus fontis TaxID=683846 RepID=A0A7J3ZKG8_9CREN
MPEVKIEPLTRIEGHASVRVLVEGGVVKDAWTKISLFRGIEIILIGRDPRDAPTITSRICGVCHDVHRMASLLALEDAAGVIPPENGVRVRNIIEAAQNAWDHLAHLTILAGPDYGVYGLASKPHPRELELDVEKYYKLLRSTIIPLQRTLHEIQAMFGGKVPHGTATVPGGATVEITTDRIGAAYNRYLTAKEAFYAIYDYLTNTFIPHLMAEHPDVVDVLLNIGVGVRNFLAYGFLPDPADPTNPDKMLFKRGVIIRGERGPLDVDKIAESVKHSWYTDRSGGRVRDEIPPEPHYGKPGAYSWCKAPRYDGVPCEVGPLARMLISGYYKPLSKHGASLLDRLLARLEETKVIMDSLGEMILDLRPGARVYNDYEVPRTAEGFGLWDAPRGALLHYVRIEDYKIARYQCVVPTTWNFSPRDERGQRGPVEEALIGCPGSETDTLNILRVVRSFDPCSACAVHVLIPKGKAVATKTLSLNV